MGVLIIFPYFFQQLLLMETPEANHMRIFDFMHAYQPFFTSEMPDWVIKNLEEVFLPLSRSLAAGKGTHTIQIQGWTLESWANNPSTSEMFKELVSNINQAIANGNVEVGFSAYSHPILPLLSNNHVEMQIEEDYKTVLKYFGEPKVFFPPEGAIDRRVLNIVTDLHPECTVLIPDKCVSEDILSGFYKYKNSSIAVFPVLVKSIVMGASFSETPSLFVPPEVDWDDARKSMVDTNSIERLLTSLELKDAIIVRDMENGGSRVHLEEMGPRMKNIPSIVGSGFSDNLVSSSAKEFQMLPEKIGPASWEPLSDPNDPFPYWSPQGEYNAFLSWQQNEIIEDWLELIAFYDEILEESREHWKETSPCLISCFPWHIIMPPEAGGNIDFSVYVLEKGIAELFTKALRNDKDKKRLNKILSRMRSNLEDMKRLHESKIDL